MPGSRPPPYYPHVLVFLKMGNQGLIQEFAKKGGRGGGGDALFYIFSRKYAIKRNRKLTQNKGGGAHPISATGPKGPYPLGDV